MGLSDRAGTILKRLSGGQKQRFAVAASLVNDPEVAILDEPTTGLDPQARRNLCELIRQINAAGTTVVLTTHYMEEAQTLCHRVAIMDAGRIVALDTPAGLLQKLALPYTVRLATSRALSSQEIKELAGALGDPVSTDVLGYRLRVKNGPRAMAQLLEWAAARQVTIEHLELVPATLEDVFLELTGKELRD